MVTEAKTSSTKYVVPHAREGASHMSRDQLGRRDDVAAIRISNLSNFAVEADLDDLVKPFGPVHKLYLAKEKVLIASLNIVKCIYNFSCNIYR